MAAALTLIYVAGSLLWVVIPICRAYLRKQEQAAEEAFFLLKLRLVRKHYKSLQDLSYGEIMQKIDVDVAFDNIGRNEIMQRRYNRMIAF